MKSNEKKEGEGSSLSLQGLIRKRENGRMGPNAITEERNRNARKKTGENSSMREMQE